MSSLSESKNNFDPCRVAIVGLGTVGGGVAEVLWHHGKADDNACLLYTSPSPRDATLSRMPSSA